MVDTYRYAPFGGLLAGGTSNNNRRFTGETQDPTGLLYLRARYYDPITGRFLTRDPFPGLATLPATQHPYVYVANNPVNLTDPAGEIPPVIVAAGVGAVIGGIGGGVSYVLAHPGGRPEDYLRSGGFRRAVLVGMASGAVSGLVGFGVGGLVSGLPGLGGAIAGGALSGAAASGAGQVTVNLLTPCTPWHSGLAWALAAGAVSGGVAGGVGYGVRSWRTPRSNTGIGWTGEVGENALKKLGGESQVYFRTSQGGRYVDQLVGGVAHESKVGYTTLTQSVQRQIAKDVELMAAGEIKGSVWHFFTSPVTGRGGPSAPLIQALEEAGIRFVIH